MTARLTVLSGPSGVGKGTLVARLRETLPQVWISVSCTTRAPRPGERDGVAYRFVSDEQFDELVASGQMLEWARFTGNRYGTPRAPVDERLAADVPTLLEIELEGARQVRVAMPDARFVFLAPPSAQELVSRLTGRGTETGAQRAARLARAEVEMAAAGEFDHVVVNDDLERAATEVGALLAGD